MPFGFFFLLPSFFFRLGMVQVQALMIRSANMSHLDATDLAARCFSRWLSRAGSPPDPNFDPMKFDFDRDPERVHETAKINDADSVFLETFAKRGKLILYHGMSDQGLSPLDTAAWYDRLEEVNGPNVQQWARLFLIPGMVHCAGGPATDQFDMLTAIRDWVEHDRAPDRIIARGESFPNITRPLCPYPLTARYQGGDTSKESSFVCSK